MKVLSLMKKLAECDGDADVVLEAPDHGFRRVERAHITTALEPHRGELYEDHGDEHKLNPNDERVPVVVLS